VARVNVTATNHNYLFIFVFIMLSSITEIYVSIWNEVAAVYNFTLGLLANSASKWAWWSIIVDHFQHGSVLSITFEISHNAHLFLGNLNRLLKYCPNYTFKQRRGGERSLVSPEIKRSVSVFFRNEFCRINFLRISK